MPAEGYAWTLVGENLTVGEPTVEGVVAGWLSSPGHCSDLMSRDFDEVGVGCVLQPAHPHVPYWALVLTRPRACVAVSRPCRATAPCPGRARGGSAAGAVRPAVPP
ncbi:CAP domain-containing protein [Hydrogenophaga sp.]|uniref:CAP domain-containing protein n=1 Tax=Hydrogenophaga sp. TaxID=1904254 RepID=UPI003BAE2545